MRGEQEGRGRYSAEVDGKTVRGTRRDKPAVQRCGAGKLSLSQSPNRPPAPCLATKGRSSGSTEIFVAQEPRAMFRLTAVPKCDSSQAENVASAVSSLGPGGESRLICRWSECEATRPSRTALEAG